jgi:hypothetical protein
VFAELPPEDTRAYGESVDVLRSTFYVLRSAFGVRRSAFGVRRSACVRPSDVLEALRTER